MGIRMSDEEHTPPTGMGPVRRTGRAVRSAQWYGGDDRNTYLHRAWMRRGTPDHAFDGRPQIAIANTASDLSPCNSHLDEVAQSVKNGVYEAGGIPYNLPVISLGETTVRTTAMLWRNMVAMAAEELFRANPVGGSAHPRGPAARRWPGTRGTGGSRRHRTWDRRRSPA
jgi:dihydroxyacid dehydratase/phosphogluconate dehydratase